MVLDLDAIAKQQNFFHRFTVDSSAAETEAWIDLGTHEITLKHPADWLERYGDDAVRKFLDRKNIPAERAVEVMLRDILYHEIGHRGTLHYRGCPETAEKLATHFLDPLHETTDIENKKTLQYLANCLTDTLNNTILKQVSASEGVTTGTGLYLAYREIVQRSEKLTKLYEGHLRLNLLFNGDRHDYTLLKDSFSYDPEVNTAILNFLQRTGLGELRGDRSAIRSYFLDDANWQDIARIYGEEFGKLIEQNMLQIPLLGSGGSEEEADSSGDRSGGGNIGGTEHDKTNAGAGDADEDGKGNIFSPQDGFGAELNRRSTVKGIIAKGHTAGTEPGWLTNFEYLEGLYELLAADKVFELVPPERDSQRFPLIDLQERRFSLEDDSVDDIIGFDLDPEAVSMILQVGKYRYDVQAKVAEEVSDVPNLVFALLDTSISMQEPMPLGPRLGKIVNPKAPQEQQWQYHSKYHVALIAYNMAVERFYDLGVADGDAYFANFSYETILSQGLQQSKQAALCPQFGGTHIDLAEVGSFFEKNDGIIFTLSDGEIENSHVLLQNIVQHCTPQTYFHVQIGDETDYSEDLRRHGFLVKLVQEERQLYDFVIDLTGALWQNS